MTWDLIGKIWLTCAILNCFNIGYNAAKERDYSWITLLSLIIGIILSPLMLAFGMGVTLGDFFRRVYNEKISR